MLDKISHRRWTSVVLMVLTMATLLGACGGDGDDVSAASPTTTTTAPPAREITVAAASDLRPAFEELGTLFTKETGTKVTFTFGSSGQLREQIVNGAPFDLFASADVGFVDEVIAKGRGVAETKADYAFGRIVLWTPNGVTPPAEIAGLTVNSDNGLLPGAFDTDRLQATMKGTADKTGKGIDVVAAERRRNIPAQRFGSAEEFGAICAFLCSVQAGYITGQNLLADGGAYPGTF